MILEVKDLNKKIKGKTILEDVNLSLTDGKVYGFVGPNGSGKTMLFRALSGLMDIDNGEVSLDGKILHKDFNILPDLGIVIENAGLYPELSGFDNLKLLSGIKKKIDDKQIRDVIEKVGLDPADKRPFRKYSLGMKQRIVLAQAIMEEPKILFLDEPTNALDEDGVDMIRKIVLDMKKTGVIILIASHNKEDISILVDEVYRIKEGKISRDMVQEV
ncbi:MAG TPA: multidrug ABC transporter ATP-binding protein [Eubacterium sp.]|nr:multidrug ABC transporter ATP-binding protein [Eubacterium sp.]HBZ53212.1 multidrug ABC transporter ATP-binding protein [Eubacterium sp.]